MSSDVEQGRARRPLPHHDAARWFSRNALRFDELGLAAAVSGSEGAGPLPKASVTIDLDSAERLGRTTCWDTGEMDLQVVDFETEAQVAFRHIVVRHEAEVRAALESFVGLVIGLPEEL